ncbi:MAG: carbohydrate transporter permease [Microbacterium sp.]|jgi:ABC-type glycerol-3-phosphate transport system permease component|uniref:carbohydrate ABC transporter permease n=1 Tax=Microbacterium sp. TaxID=51671 RepID=UPI00261E15DE|nr:carbohydrate ABC transporter permease [Microbacterium sp.]MDF2562028.1 carbohydrate transporter permease [Microbacterium sp.]
MTTQSFAPAPPRANSPATPAEQVRPRRRRPRRTVFVRSLALVLVGLVFAVPLAWMVLASFKSTSAIISETVPLTWRTFIPAEPTIENFLSLFGTYGFGRNLVNSAAIAVMQVTGAVLAATIAGYGFARLRFPGRGVLFMIVLAAAFVPMEAILLPEYRLTIALGLGNTWIGVFLPFMFSPFAVFLMRQAFAELPEEMFEAAKLDGAGHLRTFLRIAVPNVGPAFVTVVLVQFIWAWNAYIWPLLVIQDPVMQTAQVAAAMYQSVPNHPMTGEMFAASTAVTVPLVVLAIVLQRYYVRGLVMSGNK